jgi:hypothetical protein
MGTLPRRTLLLNVTALTLVGVAGVPAAVAVPRARAVYHMEEKAGMRRMMDASRLANHAVLTGGRVKQGVRGFRGRGYRFTGSGGRAVVLRPRRLNPGAAKISIVAHLKSRTPPTPEIGTYDLLRKGLSGWPGGHYKLEVWTNGTAVCSFGSPITFIVASTGVNVVDGRWHSIRCTKSSTSISVSVDGRIWRRDVAIGPIANRDPVVIGAKGDGTDSLIGKLDEVAVYIG